MFNNKLAADIAGLGNPTYQALLAKADAAQKAGNLAATNSYMGQLDTDLCG